MRHAKSSWKIPELTDIQRPLNSRGKRDAPKVGKMLSERMDPITISVSPAQRAQQTLAFLSCGWEALNGIQHTVEPDLYTFASADILQWLANLEGDAEATFIIGHNPALTDLANLLDVELQLSNLPTAGYLQLLLEIEHWREIQQACGRVTFSVFPRDL